MPLRQPHGPDPAFMGCRTFSLAGIRARATIPLLRAAGEFREAFGTPHLMLGQPLRCFSLDFGVPPRGFGAPCWHRRMEKTPSCLSSLVPTSSGWSPARAVGFDPLSKLLDSLSHPADPTGALQARQKCGVCLLTRQQRRKTLGSGENVEFMTNYLGL